MNRLSDLFAFLQRVESIARLLNKKEINSWLAEGRASIVNALAYDGLSPRDLYVSVGMEGADPLLQEHTKKAIRMFKEKMPTVIPQ